MNRIPTSMKKAFSLVEMLVVTAVLLVLVGFIVFSSIRAIENSQIRGLHSLTSSVISLVHSQCMLREVYWDNSDTVTLSFAKDMCEFSLKDSEGNLKLVAEIPVESRQIMERMRYFVSIGEDPDSSNFFQALAYSDEFGIKISYTEAIPVNIYNWEGRRSDFTLNISEGETSLPNGQNRQVIAVELGIKN